MFKKITCLCIALCMSIALMVPAYAQQKESSISSKTVITEDNLNAVLAYLGLDANSFVKTDVKGVGTRTVGDLEKGIAQAKKLPHEIRNDSNIFAPSTSGMSAMTIFAGTKMLYKTVSAGPYSVTWAVAGQYADGHWTGVGSINTTLDQTITLYTYKIDSETNSATYNDTTITLNGRENIGIYLSVSFGYIKMGSQVITTYTNFDYGLVNA